MPKPRTMDIEGIAAEYKWGEHMVIFSHGFGVDRTSRGLFSDFTEDLPEGYGYVLFDYNDTTDEGTLLNDLSAQEERFRTILNWVRTQAGVIKVSVVAHSMGCITVALAQPSSPHAVIMLAPPLVMSTRTREYFTGKKGARHAQGNWLVPRKDGTTSVIPDSLFDEFEKLDITRALQDYAEFQYFTIIGAGKDEVLPGMAYKKLAEHLMIDFKEIKGADHNFTKKRNKLIDLVIELLEHKDGGRERAQVVTGYGGSVY